MDRTNQSGELHARMTTAHCDFPPRQPSQFTNDRLLPRSRLDCTAEAISLLRVDSAAGATYFLSFRMLSSFIIAFSLSLCLSAQRVSGFGILRSQGVLSKSSTLLSSMKKEAKRKAATASPKPSKKRKERIDQNSILSAWVSHQDESFHEFQPVQAQEVRLALLTWYRANRRKLPWRGDAPPFDGSTAGIATNDTKKKKVRGQPSIRNFFEPSSTTDATKPGDDSTSSNEGALEVTGYGVWVSEIMLQQTRVEAVIPYYVKWMKRFPTVYDLAAASEEEVNAHWAGLGFYRRARLLHKGAKRVVEEYSGELPKTVSELLKIDGIGRYTASAIASIAFDVCVPVVDGNVCRVLSRLVGIANNIKAPVFKDDVAWKLAEQIVRAGDGKHAGEVNQAIMELGATYCAPSGSGVDDRDPLKEFYLSTKLGVAFAQEWKEDRNFSKWTKESTCRVCDRNGIHNVFQNLSASLDDLGDAPNPTRMQAAIAGHGAFPLPPPKQSKKEEVLAVATISCGTKSDERWLLVKRPKDGLLAGQWEFPSTCVWASEGRRSKKGAVNKGGTQDKNIPHVDARRREEELDSFLDELSTTDDCSKSRSVLRDCPRENVGSSPLEHVFSHVRHTMWIEYGKMPTDNVSTDGESQVASNGREVRWMSEKDMSNVGVTSGVRKILKLVKAERANGLN